MLFISASTREWPPYGEAPRGCVLSPACVWSISVMASSPTDAGGPNCQFQHRTGSSLCFHSSSQIPVMALLENWQAAVSFYFVRLFKERPRGASVTDEERDLGSKMCLDSNPDCSYWAVCLQANDLAFLGTGYHTYCSKFVIKHQMQKHGRVGHGIGIGGSYYYFCLLKNFDFIFIFLLYSLQLLCLPSSLSSSSFFFHLNNLPFKEPRNQCMKFSAVILPWPSRGDSWTGSPWERSCVDIWFGVGGRAILY